MVAGNQHLYQVVYESLLKNICDGTLAEGDRLPSENELTEQFGVSRITTKKALNMLAEKGYIIRRAGLGSFVRAHGAPEREEENTSGAPEEGKGGIIGLVMEDFTDSYGLEILRAIEKRTYELGYYLCIRRSHGKPEIEKRVIDQLLELRVNGIIVMPTHGLHYNTELLRMVIEGYPIVFIDRFLSGIPAPYVGTDNLNVSIKLTEYLFERGHRNIALVTPPATEAITLRDRIDGFRTAYQQRGWEQDRNLLLDTICSTIPGQDTEENIKSDSAQIEAFLREHPEVTAVIATEYLGAVMVRKATQRMGLRIPEDVSLACFDSPISLQGEYYFTHIEQRETEMGIRAVDLLRRQIVVSSTEPQQIQVILDADIVDGFSVRHI